MNQAIAITLTPRAAGLFRKHRDGGLFQRTLAGEMNRENQLTIAHIQRQRLTGVGPFPPSQGKLGVKSGQLRAALQATSATVTAGQILSKIGDAVRYAAIHEFGGTFKRVLLAGSARLRTDKRGNLLRQGRNGGLAVFAKPTHNNFTTVQWSGGKRYTVTFPARAPILRGIMDRVDKIGQGLSRGIEKFERGTAA